MSLFPTIVATSDLIDKEGLISQDKLPEGQFTHIVGGNGVFLLKRNPLFDAVVKTDQKIPDVAERLKLHVPKISYEDFRKVEAFFRKIYDLHKSEAAVILYAHEKAGWLVEVPEQTVRGLSVSYNRADMPRTIKRDGKEYLRFGTIHSHAGIGAFHSSTDDADEKHIDGFHVTIGNVNQYQCSYSCRFIVHGTIFKAEIGDWVDFPKDQLAAPEAWVKQVSMTPVQTQPAYTTPSHQYYGPASHKPYSHDDEYWHQETGGFSPTTPSTAGGYRSQMVASEHGKNVGVTGTRAGGIEKEELKLGPEDHRRRRLDPEGFTFRRTLEHRAGQYNQKFSRYEIGYREPKELRGQASIASCCYCAHYIPGKQCSMSYGITDPNAVCSLFQEDTNHSELRQKAIENDLDEAAKLQEKVDRYVAQSTPSPLATTPLPADLKDLMDTAVAKDDDTKILHIPETKENVSDK